MGMGFIGWIIIGGLAGWIASMVMNRHHNVLVNIVIGIIGAFIGGWVNDSFIHFVVMGPVSGFVVAFAGSLILLFVLGLINRPKGGDA